jgi:hypothetical protein
MSWQSRGDARPTDPDANPSGCGRVQLLRGLKTLRQLRVPERTSTSSMAVIESSSALNRDGHRRNPLMGRDREFGERSYV